MQAGLIGAWERLRYTLTATPDASGVYTLTATLRSRHARNLTDWQEIALLQIVVTRDASGNAQTQFTAQFLNHLYTFTASNASGGSLRLEWIAPRWYMRAVGSENEWYFTWLGVEVYRGGVLVASWAGGSYSVVLSGERYKAPAAAPLLWTQIGAAASASYVPPSDDGAYSDSSSAQVVVQGGWEVRVDNQWQAFPVRLLIDSPQSAGCGLSLPYTPQMSATDTVSASLTARAMAFYSQTEWQQASCFCVDSNGNPGTVPYVYRWRDIITEGKNESAQVWLIPNLPRVFDLLSTEPIRALIYRAPLPKAEVIRSTQSSRFRLECGNDITCMETNADTVVRHPLTAEFLGVYAGGSHPLTTPIEGDLTAPYRWQAEWNYQHTRPNEVVAPGNCPNVPPEEPPIEFTTCMCPPDSPLRFQSDTKQVSAVLDYPSVSDDMLGYYQHQEPIARYINSWVNPHWSYFLWWQDWSLGVPLTPVSRDEYWRLLQQQWLWHPELPPAEKTKQRNQCVLEPLTVSPYLSFVEDNLLGYKTLWAGACRFDALAMTPASSKVLDSSSQPRWSATGASLAFTGTGIVATPTQATSTLEFDLTDWQTPPYLYPAIADKVRVSITGVYEQVQVYLVNFEGDTVLLDADPNDSTLYPYKSAVESVYAGSWAQSYAAEVAGYSETGADLLTQGRSSTVMGDAARRTLFEMLGNRTPAKLRIVVQQVAPTPYTLAYPTFYSDARASKAYPETAHAQAVVDGNHLWRHGGLDFQLTTPVPQLRPAHQSPTVYDALCIRNLLYRGESYQHQMTADANALYDSVEWTGQYADLRMDTRAIVYPLRQRSSPLMVLINAYREVPPLACLPRRKRNATTLAEDGDWGQWQYLISPLRRYIVNPDAPLHMHRVEYDSGGSETGRQVVTTYLESINNCHSVYHELALENNEVLTRWDGQPLNSPRYHLHLQGADYARATPFHGYSAVVRVSQQAGQWVALTRSSAFRAARAYVQNNTLYVGYARDVILQDWEDTNATLTATQPALVYLPAAQRLALAVQVGSEVRIYTQTSEGGAWTMATTVATGAHPTLIATSDGRIYCYYYRSGAIYGKQYDSAFQVIGSEFTAISPADDAEIDAVETVTAQGKSLIAIIYRDGGAVKVKTSLDGRQFS